MKTLGYVLIGFVSIVCLTGIVSSKAEASVYIGEYCWKAEDANGPILVIKLGVFDNGGGHYYLSGVNSFPTEGAVISVHGNAEWNGGNIIMTLNLSGMYSWGKSDGTSTIILNSALNGSYFSLQHEYGYCQGSAVEKHCLEYYHGIVTLVFCP